MVAASTATPAGQRASFRNARISLPSPHAAAAVRARRWTCRASAEEEGTSSSGLPEALPVAEGMDWRAFRASLVQRERKEEGKEAEVWAHGLPRAEQGCLLLAHPLFFTTSQTYFRNSVVLLFAHSATGSAGLILNLASEHTCETAVQESEQLEELQKAQLYVGGDVGSTTMHILHGVPGLEQSVEVVPGVYLGGWEGAKLRIRSGLNELSEFKVLCRYAGWRPGQLDEEVERGVWFPAAASKEAILAQGPDATGSAAWHRLMSLMGGEYAELSAALLQPQVLPGLNLGGQTSGEGGGSGSEQPAPQAEEDQDTRGN